MDSGVPIEGAVGPQAPTRRGLRLRLPSRRRRPPQAPVEMTLVAHLVELRHRVFISLLSLVPGAILGFILSGEIIHVLRAPLPTDQPLQALGLTDALMIQLQIALVTGVIVGMPVILYQLWAFISPGLTPSERSAARPWVPMAMLFFALGVALAYLILPIAASFLYSFQSEDIHILLTADSYFGFVSTLFLVFGLALEFPVVLVLLAKVGLLSSQKLRRSRRMAILGIVIVSNLITPGADLVSPLAMAATLYSLYELAIVLIRLDGK